ncbi:MAG: High-affinity branched-chain amino acid transport system permease protein LivH [Herbaspirillum frisingense]|uniref:High-affinity branched-chain amino acid transport system permease protein LivH n=1 Tax=Herbaspirillum frisingense TaxID=92645 RepID=A0A7V8FWV9_9BURK|nr:MAG: High-affinity branched-chain amino acid transport system permease protein LivH [Herbaspirillum frisingense]
MNIYLLQIANGVGIGMLYFLLAVGLSIVFGLLRFVNFSHGAFFLLGAYLCFQIADMGISFWWSLLVAPLLVGLFAWVVERFVLRHVYALPHHFHILFTVGLALVLQEAVISIWGPLGNNVSPPDLLQGVVMAGGFVYPKYRLFVIGVTAVMALLLPLALSSGTLATEVLVFALAALGCNLLLGYTGLMSFGQGIFFGVGSYTAGVVLLQLKLPLLPALALAALGGAVTALLVGWFSIRQRGTYFVMLTLAFAQMFYFLAYTMKDVTGGDNGLLDIPRPPLALFGLTLLPTTSSWQYYTVVAILFVLVFWLLQRVVDSVLGRTLLAVRDNEARASALGYDIRLLKLAAFVISGAVTGLAGGLHAMMTGVAPLSNIEYHTSEAILVMTVIGGTGNLFASVLGASFYVLAGNWLSTLWPRWLMLLGLLLIAVSLYMQKGLFGLALKIIHALRPGVDKSQAAPEAIAKEKHS